MRVFVCGMDVFMYYVEYCVCVRVFVMCDKVCVCPHV